MRRARLPFVLRRSLGEGNFGRLYLAELRPDRHGSARQVVVKLMTAGAGDAEFESFAAEIELLGRVTAPNLVRPVLAGHDRGLLYYAVRLPPHNTLAEPSVPLSVPERLAALADAAQGAAALHAAGRAHCDIRPHNVYLYRDAARLADLGLAQVLANVASHDLRGPMGMIDFMAPEIARGGRPDPAADVWSLGATLHHALTGRGVYAGIPKDGLAEALRHVWDAPIHIHAAVPAPVADALRACLDGEPPRRPSASELASRLREAG